jgi:hypothetical protein
MPRQPGSSQFLKEYRMPIELRFDDIDLREEPGHGKADEGNDTQTTDYCSRACTWTCTSNTCTSTYC